MKNLTLLTTILAAFSILSANANTKEFEGQGTITLLNAKWNEPINQEETNILLNKLTLWDKENLFVPYKVIIFGDHEMVKEMNRNPLAIVTLKNNPDIKIWIPIKKTDSLPVVGKPWCSKPFPQGS